MGTVTSSVDSKYLTRTVALSAPFTPTVTIAAYSALPPGVGRVIAVVGHDLAVHLEDRRLALGRLLQQPLA